MPISGSGIGTADTKKALLALLTFQSGIGDMAPFVTIALGHSRESQETTGRGGGGVGGGGVGRGELPGGGALFPGLWRMGGVGGRD